MIKYPFKDLRFDRMRRPDSQEAIGAWINTRDCLRLMDLKISETFGYKPTEAEKTWLDEQLRAYCMYSFPFLGVFRSKRFISRRAKRFHHTLRNSYRFGVVYMILVANLRPTDVVEFLHSDPAVHVASGEEKCSD
jgi:hypothetical protein